MILNALLTAIAAIAGADIAPGDCYLLCRIASTGTVSSPGSRPAPPPALGRLATAEPHTAAPSSGSEGIGKAESGKPPGRQVLRKHGPRLGARRINQSPVQRAPGE